MGHLLAETTEVGVFCDNSFAIITSVGKMTLQEYFSALLRIFSAVGLKLSSTNDRPTLKPFEKTTAGPAGTIFAYGIDIFHRATNITKSGAYRYAVTSCFKKAGNDKIGFTAWPYHQQKPWQIIFENASPEQLNCFGVPMPGDPFWDQNTIQLANLRYPGWDMSEYKKKIMTK